MKFSVAALAAGLVALATSANAFQAPHVSRPATSSLVSSRFMSSSVQEETPCATPDIIPPQVTAKALRSALLTDANGNLVKLGQEMGNDWCALQQDVTDGNIQGPLFVSIGDEEKLNIFLDKNPSVPRSQAFVDGYDFSAYEAAGFGRFDEVDKDVAKQAMSNMAAPELEGGAKGWWNYATSAGKLAPIPKDMKFGDVPEGVLRLGGTFVVKGGKILYRWSDRVPGDHPDIQEVLEIAKEASAKNFPFAFPSFGN